MKIYIAGKISGNTYDECAAYFEETKKRLLSFGYEVLSPMTNKAYLRTEYHDRELPSAGYCNFVSPVATNHAIFERDQWCVRNCDIIYVNLINADKNASIGCTMELAWGAILGKHTVVSMQKDNIHRHAFVLEAADIIFEEHEDAMTYLFKWIKQIG